MLQKSGDTDAMLEQIIDRVIKTEGGYVDHPADRGGPTNYGITLNTLSRHRGKWCTAKDVQDMPVEEARTIYMVNYWIEPGFSTLNVSPVIGEMLFDAAVNHGQARSVKILQDSIGVLADGHLGPITRKHAETVSTLDLACGLIAGRVEYYGKIITRDPSQAVFAHGWMRRAAGFIKTIPFA